jgi:hypothetical protein
MELSANKSLCLGHQIGSPEPVLCVLVPYAVHYVCSGETPEDSLLPKLSGTPIYHLRLPLLRPFQGPSNTRTLFPLPSFSFPHIISSVYTGYHRITEGSHKHHHEIIVISGSHYGKVRVKLLLRQDAGRWGSPDNGNATLDSSKRESKGRRKAGRGETERRTDLPHINPSASRCFLYSTCVQAEYLLCSYYSCLLCQPPTVAGGASSVLRAQAASHRTYPYRIQHLKLKVEVKSNRAKQHSRRISDRLLTRYPRQLTA